MANVETELEEEIRLELERLEEIFSEETSKESASNSTKVKPNRVSYSAYEYAEAEGDKEELEDQLKSLVSKTDDYNDRIRYLSRVNTDLQLLNDQLQLENARLRSSLGQDQLTEIYNESSGVIGLESYGVLSPGSVALEHLLAETRAKLLLAEGTNRDILIVRDVTMQELEKERALRIHVEKERDAYSAAYEASLQHFEKWTKTKT